MLLKLSVRSAGALTSCQVVSSLSERRGRTREFENSPGASILKQTNVNRAKVT